MRRLRETKKIEQKRGTEMKRKKERGSGARDSHTLRHMYREKQTHLIAIAYAWSKRDKRDRRVSVSSHTQQEEEGVRARDRRKSHKMQRK